MRAWHLPYPLVWAVVFIRYKAMREAYQWIRTVSSHTLLFIIKSRTEGTGRCETYIMGYLGNLSEDSLRRIKNIENGFRNYPAYSTYQIRNFIYDFRAGIHALEVTRNGEPVNLFLFLPGDGGKIGNIALYGSNLQGH